jgi:hypothetical protein
MKIRKVAGICALLLMVAGAAQAESSYMLGVEAYYDRYQEPQSGVRVDSRAGYGGIIGTYSYATGRLNLAVDARLDAGVNHYHSVDGSSDGEPQYESEERLRIGTSFNLGNAMLLPYTGVGVRLFFDNGKGYFTNLGYAGYDRRIAQFYVPVGAKLNFVTSGGWSVSPVLEYDQLIVGKVNSRLANVGDENMLNTQHQGYGVRGELMFGRDGWEAGPFVRYWNIKDSDITCDSLGNCGLEPRNDRIQIGADLRARF